MFKINIRYERKSMGGTIGDEQDEGEKDVEAGEQDDFSTVERKARLIMRTDGVHRLVLNTPVFKDMNVGTHDGQEPTGRTMHLTGLEEGKPTGYQIKVSLNSGRSFGHTLTFCFFPGGQRRRFEGHLSQDPRTQGRPLKNGSNRVEITSITNRTWFMRSEVVYENWLQSGYM